MGKPTGFLEFARVGRPAVPARERVGSFGEFHTEPDAETRTEQGERCMNCGVPFCQSDYGCPLHNLIPEWNDEISARNMEYALRRLLKTNDFPEFTGRVCPALCENACVCSLGGEAVTIRDNELAVIERAWASGLMKPEPPSVRTGKRVAVVGSGPAGLAAAQQLNRRGHSVTVYERDDRPGGLLMYGIPNMKLEKAVVLRRIAKMEAEGIRFVCGTEVGKGLSSEELKAEYDAVILCCGARRERSLGVDTAGVRGVVPALEYLSAATRSLLDGSVNPSDARGLRVVVVGNGDTATDCVATALRQGAASVTQLVRRQKRGSPEKIWPYPADGEKTDYGQEEAAALFGSDPRLYATTVRKVIADESGKLCSLIVQTDGRDYEIGADLLLTATGFSGAESETGGAFGLEPDGKGRFGDEEFRTSDPNVFVCGDMRRGASLVVWAIAEGRACARVVDRELEGYTNL